MKAEEMKVGGTYFIIYEGRNYIMRPNEIRSDCAIDEGHIMDNSWSGNKGEGTFKYRECRDLREATSEEVFWFNKCRKLNRFVSKDLIIEEWKKPNTRFFNILNQ